MPGSARIPEQLSFTQAASIPIGGLTACIVAATTSLVMPILSITPGTVFAASTRAYGETAGT
jgi:NADPH:quinone reductase-like Zn-dependent oxidoreductase